MAEITLALTDDVTSPKPRVDQKVLNFLVSIGFMAPDPFSPVLLDGQFSPTLAVLLLTNQCQLRCTYCYAAAGESVREQLSPDLGYAAIDYVYQNACAQGREGFDVSFHGGGEPTFAWTTLKQCTQYARQKSLKSHITLTSNGVWSSQQTAWIIDNIDGLSLSVDGMPETQDRQRPLRSGRGSSPFVKRTIAELDRHDFPYGLRLTATHPWTLADDVRFLCEETKCQAMQVEPAFNESRGGHGEPDDEDITGFVEEFLEAHSIAEAAGRTLFYSGARFGLVTTMFCTAPYNALIVNANGDLVACYEVASDNHPLSAMSVIGRVKDGEVVPDEAAHRRLHDLMAERRADCRDCFCYWSCAGDCYARAFGPEPGDHLRRKGRCTINQRLMERLILRHIAKSEGVWQGAVYSAPAPTPHEACNIPAQNVSVQNTTSASHA
ncbi:MAG: SPASM domain-containing protein [Anaerolineae bacterium]|nr:SPASM domain-containing protein [Anaerolineae bacterium]